MQHPLLQGGSMDIVMPINLDTEAPVWVLATTVASWAIYAEIVLKTPMGQPRGWTAAGPAISSPPTMPRI